MALLWAYFAILIQTCAQKSQASHYIQTSLQDVEAGNTFVDHTYRTTYHFQPSKNWMNDPNGPMLYKGIYHLFYQYNPKGAVWGNIVWAHSTSTDLINWISHPHAIKPSQDSDINGCWSGSATILPHNKPFILYTGLNPHNHQVQNLALPKNLSDPFLVEWTKSRRNPLMSPTPSNKINASSFRDPTTGWLGPDRKWRVTVGSADGDTGIAILYKSEGVDDFERWSEARTPLHTARGTGMWECVDFYPVLGRKGVDTSAVGPEFKHVLKMSLDRTRHDIYVVGKYDVFADKFIPDHGSVENDAGLRYDYGKFYASKTFYDSEKRRRVLWGWVNESSSVNDDRKKGWSGIQAIPRSIWLDKSRKQLVQWPVAEIKKLRQNPMKFRNKKLMSGSLLQISHVSPVAADVEMNFDIKGIQNAEEFKRSWKNPNEICQKMPASVNGGVGPFGLLVLASKGLEEYTAVFFRIFKAQSKHILLMCSDQSRSSKNRENDRTSYGAFMEMDPTHPKVSLRTLIDHSVVESFGGRGRTCITARVYPTLAINDKAHLYAFNNGSSCVTISKLTAWTMKKANIN